MKISDVKISIVTPKDGLIAFASVVLDSGFYVGGIAIHEKLDGTGYRLTYPTRKAANQTFIAEPIIMGIHLGCGVVKSRNEMFK